MIPKHRNPTHPGEILLKEFLEPMGISQLRLAEHIEVPVQRVNELVNGKRGITPDTAWKLAGALGTTAEFWTHLQAAYDLGQDRPDRQPGLVDPAWELKQRCQDVIDAVQGAQPWGPGRLLLSLGVMIEARPDELLFSLSGSLPVPLTYEYASTEIAKRLVQELEHVHAMEALEGNAAKAGPVNEALAALRAVQVQPPQLNTVDALIQRAGGIRNVRIWKQPAIGLSHSIRAADEMARRRGQNPWAGGCRGYTTSLTSAQYEELRRRGAVEEEPHI